MLRISFDIGGTFTDFVLDDGRAGLLRFHKVPSTPGDPATAVLSGLATLLERAGAEPAEVTGLLHATTVATNAILERKGVRTALVTTKGFRDVLIIGRQKRYDTYDMYLAKPKPLVRRRDILEVAERCLADGTVEAPLGEAEIARLAGELAGAGYDSIAVSLLHSYAAPAHEQAIGAALAKRLPGTAVTLSSDVSPKYREYERTSTAVANAYIKPIVGRYVRRLEEELKGQGIAADLFIMQSNGGLVSPELAREMPIRIVESGPAAGVLLCGVIGREEGFERVLTFDMGGTTAKLGAIDHGEPAITPTFEVDQVRYRKGSGLPVNVPAVELIEIGAGGGSIAHTDLGLIKVGPESAGADPGPACYGRGGKRPTVTDANLVLGYINPDYFNGGAMRLDREAAAAVITEHLAKPLGLGLEEAAAGIITLANANMERAMRLISLERGRDPRKYVLVAFGGAGPLHAARLARALGIPKIIVPFGAGVGSAIGMLEANARLDASLTRLLPLAPGVEGDIADVYARLEARVAGDVERMRGKDARAAATAQRFAYLRYRGQGHEIRVDLPEGAFDQRFIAETVARFEAAYEQKYGYRQPGALVEAVDWYVVVTLANAAERAHRDKSWKGSGGEGAPARARASRKAYFADAGGWVDCSVVDRASLAAGAVIDGPAIIEEAEATTLLPANARAEVSPRGNLVITL